MPCDSTITTKMTSLTAIAEAVKDFADARQQGNVLLVTDRKTNTTLRFVQYGDQPVQVSANYGRQIDLLNSVQRAYVKAKVKMFAKQYGYTVSRDAMTGEYVLAGYAK